MKNVILKNKILLSILLIVSILILVFVYNDYYLYKTPILKITKIETKEKANDRNKEIIYEQKITGIILNGKHKNEVYELENITSKSGVYDEQINKNSELFLDISNDKISIIGIKRDKYIVILIVLFIDLIILVGKSKSIRILLSLLVNVIVSSIVIFWYQNHYNDINILFLFLPISVMFIVLSLFITNGKNKKTLAAIISSIISLFISFSLSIIILKLYNNTIPYWNMEYIEIITDYKNLYYVNILLCGLGAIMDIAITMASSIKELIEKDSNITLDSLLKSGKEISKDITGTMTNVMLFTCYTAVIPMFLLALKNRMTIANTIHMYGQLEMIRVLTSSISIVLCVPISLYVSVYILKRWKHD
ncbi:MAG: YibE/F family protein [Bacilli bacterium]|nr:YibE/F family protein [Bacilli bacterium]